MANPYDQFDAGNPYDQFDGPSAGQDIANVAPGAAGLGLANTLASVLPFPGAQSLLSNAPEAISRKLTGQPLYEAQTIPGKIVDKAIQFAPAAAISPGGAATKTAMTLAPAVASTLAGEAAPQGYKEIAEIGGALLSPFGVQAAVKPFATRAARAKLLNTAEIKQARDAIYTKAREIGILIKPGSYRDFAADLVQTLQKAKYKLNIASKATGGLLETIVDDAKSARPQNLGDLHTISERIGDLIDSTDGTTRGLGKLMYAKIQAYKRSLTQADVISPDGIDPQMAVQLEREADALHGRFKKSELLDTIYRKAKNRGANYTVAGEALGIRQKFRALADKFADPNTPEARYFSKEEQDAIEKVARGGFTQNRIRDLSKLMATNLLGAGLTSVGTGVGAMMGGPVGALIGGSAPTIAGLPFKIAESVWTKANANRVSDLIRGGKKLIASPVPYPGLLGPLALQ